MNESALARMFRPIALAALLLLAACRSDPGEPPLAGATMGGAFTLTDQQGRQVREADFAGKYRLVYFGFTFCPDVCPVDLQVIGAGLRRFEESDAARAAKVQPIFISVDPARDTPQVIGQYVANFHPRIIGLTGSEAEVSRVARAYGVYFERQPPAQPGGDYLVNHSRMIVLYGPEGQPIAIVPHDQGAEGVAAELDRWVR